MNRFLTWSLLGAWWLAALPLSGNAEGATAQHADADRAAAGKTAPARKKKKKVPAPANDDARSSVATPTPEGAAPTLKKFDADADPVTPPTRKKAPVAGDDPAVAPRSEKPEHAPAASMETSQLVDFPAQPAPVQQLIQAALDLTKRNLTYAYGSADPAAGGMDCSGTMHYLLRSQGLKDVPRDSSEQYLWARQHGRFFAVMSSKADGSEFAELQPGDLMFWTGTYKSERTVPITHVMLYLGREKDSGKRVMFGSSDGRSYHGVQRWGVSVFDFTMPRTDPANPEKRPRFIGYGRIPALRESAPVVTAAKPEIPLPSIVVAKTERLVAPGIEPAAAPLSAPVPSIVPPPISDPLHEPERGSAERKAIMDALRTGPYATPAKSVVFAVNTLKVHNGWAWADVTPQDREGRRVGERFTALLQCVSTQWQAVEAGKLPPGSGIGTDGEGPNHGVVRSLQETFPSVPADIFPASARSPRDTL